MLGFPVPVPQNGDDFDATPLAQNLTYLLQTLQSYDASNILAGSLGQAAFDSDTNPRTRYIDMFQSFVVGGGLSSGFAVLAYSVPSISGAYFQSNGKRLPTVTGASFTAAINSDTYVYVNSSGQILHTDVANNDSMPALPTADSQWLQKVISNGTTITSIVDLRVLRPVGVVSNPYRFLAYASAAATTSAGAAKIVLDGELYDTSNNFDKTTNYRFTAPITGVYHFSGNVNITQGASATLSTMLYKNGTSYVVGGPVSNSGSVVNNAASIDVDVPLVAGDYIEMFAITTFGAGATINVGSTPLNTYLSGHLVSA